MDDTYDWYESADSDEQHSLRVLGHKVLVRKCKRDTSDYLFGEPDPNVELSRESQMMVDSIADGGAICSYMNGIKPTNICEVLAVGSKVGERRSDDDMTRYKIPRKLRTGGRKYYVHPGSVCPIKVGDFVALPETSQWGTMWRGVTGSMNDLIVDKADLIAIFPNGE